MEGTILIISLLLLALAVSMDGLGVGITYGLRRIHIPLKSILIISLCSGAVVLISMLVGTWLSTLFSFRIASFVGAGILILIGCWSLVQYIVNRLRRQDEDDTLTSDSTPQEKLTSSVTPGNMLRAKEWSIEIKRLGLVIQILRTPHVADIDASGVISATEALLLGIALSLDSLGVGLGAALTGLPPLWTALLIFLACGTLLAVGLRIGFHYSKFAFMRAIGVLPGLVLIAIGVLRLLQ
jgi:putative sporulation protein YtaF